MSKTDKDSERETERNRDKEKLFERKSDPHNDDDYCCHVKTPKRIYKIIFLVFIRFSNLPKTNYDDDDDDDNENNC